MVTTIAEPLGGRVCYFNTDKLAQLGKSKDLLAFIARTQVLIRIQRRFDALLPFFIFCSFSDRLDHQLDRLRLLSGARQKPA